MWLENIPFEIQAEILKRLPLKPLLQFRCVSKSFKCLIDSRRYFIMVGDHPQPRRRFIGWRESSAPPNQYPIFTCVDDDDDGFVEEGSFSLPFPPIYGEPYPFFVGSSHGLVCLKKISNTTEMVVLWNPSLRKSVRIPVPDSPNYNFRNYWDGNYNFGNYGDDDVVGFGVCPVTFDPTILKIKRKSKNTKDMPGAISSLPWKVRVFTLSTGTWSILSTHLPRESIRLRGSQVVIHRFIYWAAFDYMLEDGRSQSPFLIMSFDLIAKEFKEINLTGSLTDRLCSIQAISNLRESLVLLEYHREFEDGEPVCCLWMMMKKQGVNISFTKLYNINVPHATVKGLLGFTANGELILVTTKQDSEFDAELEIYDPNSEAIDNLEIDGFDYLFFMCSYMETLLLLDKLDGFIYSISI